MRIDLNGGVEQLYLLDVGPQPDFVEGTSVPAVELEYKTMWRGRIDMAGSEDEPDSVTIPMYLNEVVDLRDALTEYIEKQG